MVVRIVNALVLLGGYGCYCVWGGIENRNWSYIVVGAPLILTAVGIIARLRFALWMTYFIAAVTVVICAIAFGISIQMRLFPLATAFESALSLVPGLVFVGAVAFCADTVRRWYGHLRAHG